MAVYRLTPKAATDLEGIYEYTISRFGLAQARDYLGGLHRHFDTLVERPTLGRAADLLAPRLRRSEYRSHVVFYMSDNEDVRIVRVLHKRMDASRHFVSGG